MSNINLKRFVDINIQQHIASSIRGTRDTVALFTPEGTLGQTKTISSLSQAISEYGDYETTLAYLTMYFVNSGVKAYVIEGVELEDLTANMIAELNNEIILVAYAGADEDVDDTYLALKEIAIERNDDAEIYGINEKLILSRVNLPSPILDTDNIPILDTNGDEILDTAELDEDEVRNFVVKCSRVLGAEMTIAAYLTKINTYNSDTVYDYMFTAENIEEEDISDSFYEAIIATNLNIDIRLSGAIRNCGGNCKNGADIVNTFVRIVLHQTVTDRLIELLTQKIKNSSGVSKIYSTLSEELEKYRICGYLTTDKIWTDNTMKVVVNDVEYTIIEKGTALTSGYQVKILPITSLTAEDKIQRKAPRVYVILADQYGIRSITISGEVI